MKPIRAATAAAITAVLAAGLTACDDADDVSYAPVAYGVPGHCYYVDSPAEAVALRSAGLCPAAWAPTLMPLAWHEQYYPYYSSPAYYNVYVPASSRVVYTRTETTFGTTYKTQISTATKTATYKGSNGKTVPASKIGTSKFGSGNSFSSSSGNAKYGGGARNGGSSVSKSSGGSSSSRSGSTSSRSSGFGGGARGR